VSVWPLILFLIGAVLVLSVLGAIFVGSERLTQRLTRRRFGERDDTGGAGGGELYGAQGLIDRGRGEDLYPRDEGR